MPPSAKTEDDQTQTMLARSIKEFISTCLTQVTRKCSSEVKTIAISTTDWGNYLNTKRLVELVIDVLKSELETEQFSNQGWTILFIIDGEQLTLYDLFAQTIRSKSTESIAFQQFYCPISSMCLIRSHLLEN